MFFLFEYFVFMEDAYIKIIKKTFQGQTESVHLVSKLQTAGDVWQPCHMLPKEAFNSSQDTNIY